MEIACNALDFQQSLASLRFLLSPLFLQPTDDATSSRHSGIEFEQKTTKGSKEESDRWRVRTGSLYLLSNKDGSVGQ